MSNKKHIYYSNNACPILRMDGKGGWHYIEIPAIEKINNIGWGMTKAHVMLNSKTYYNMTLMPLGNKRYMIPLNATIRKDLNVELGNTLNVEIYSDIKVLTDSEEKAFDDKTSLLLKNIEAESLAKTVEFLNESKNKNKKKSRLHWLQIANG